MMTPWQPSLAHMNPPIVFDWGTAVALTMENYKKLCDELRTLHYIEQASRALLILQRSENPDALEDLHWLQLSNAIKLHDHWEDDDAVETLMLRLQEIMGDLLSDD